MTDIDKSRCPFVYFSLTSNQTVDTRCILDEGHIGEHIKREIFPPPQLPPKQGWVKMQTTVEKESCST